MKLLWEHDLRREQVWDAIWQVCLLYKQGRGFTFYVGICFSVKWVCWSSHWGCLSVVLYLSQHGSRLHYSRLWSFSGWFVGFSAWLASSFLTFLAQFHHLWMVKSDFSRIPWKLETFMSMFIFPLVEWALENSEMGLIVFILSSLLLIAVGHWKIYRFFVCVSKI